MLQDLELPDRSAKRLALLEVARTQGVRAMAQTWVQGMVHPKRLQDAGVPVIYRCYDSLAHGFTAFTGAVPAADEACREIAGLVRDAYAERRA